MSSSKWGAEIIRLWVASVDASGDVGVSMDILRQVSEGYRKIRNTFRYMLANTADFDPEKDRVAYKDLRKIDQYLEVKLNDLVAESIVNYDKYDFADVYKLVFKFITNDLSAFYLDFAKDVLYIEGKDSHARRSMQTVIYDAAVKLAKILAPILPHTMGEVWGYLKEKEEDVYLSNFPEIEDYADADDLKESWGRNS